MSKRVINYTPHPLTLFHTDGKTSTVLPSVGVARVKQDSEVVEILNLDGGDLPIVRSTFGEVEGLPDPDGETIFIVSSMVAAAAKNRDDLVSPTGFIRDAEGKILGATGLQRLA